MTTLFYPGTDPTVTRVGLAHYGESLAAHSFFRVHGPQKSRTADPHHLTHIECKPQCCDRGRYGCFVVSTLKRISIMLEATAIFAIAVIFFCFFFFR